LEVVCPALLHPFQKYGQFFDKQCFFASLCVSASSCNKSAITDHDGNENQMRDWDSVNVID